MCRLYAYFRIPYGHSEKRGLAPVFLYIILYPAFVSAVLGNAASGRSARPEGDAAYAALIYPAESSGCRTPPRSMLNFIFFLSLRPSAIYNENIAGGRSAGSYIFLRNRRKSPSVPSGMSEAESFFPCRRGFISFLRPLQALIGMSPRLSFRSAAASLRNRYRIPSLP